MKVISKLKKSLAEQCCMRITTAAPEGEQHYNGVVMLIRDSFVVLREERDFEFQGLVVLPRKVITGYRDGKPEKCLNQILRHNKQLARLKSPRWLGPCETLPALLRALMKKYIWPSVEIDLEHDAQFYIGPLREVREDGFLIQHYTAEGKWEKVYAIDYDWLRKIEFGDRYSKHFNAFMRQDC